MSMPSVGVICGTALIIAGAHFASQDMMGLGTAVMAVSALAAFIKG